MSERKRVTLTTLDKKRADGAPLTMITCYDYSMAHWVEQAGLDIILVGDSLGMTMLGYDSTLPVTMEDIIRHARAVRRGAPTCFVVADMPYMSYQPSDQKAVENAGRLMAETGSDAVVVQLQRDTDDVVALVAQQRSRHRAVDAARHGNDHTSLFRRLGNAQAVQRFGHGRQYRRTTARGK